MKIAIPIWEKGISPVFDTASRFLIIEVDDQKETSRFEIYLDEHDLPRRCYRIHEMGIDILICGAISRPFSSMLIATGVDVVPGISGQTEEVLGAYLKGDLFSSRRFLMPGCRKDGLQQGRRRSACKKDEKKWKRGLN
ncbi:MAG: NifB/NifX family molybdenum-iron cluster-binding protein [Deltaproteobacteria bacterium]|nr:NifB/NifX family molybdenum-iron cluster-binding protein [Deltaproteobacteria bacterium]